MNKNSLRVFKTDEFSPKIRCVALCAVLCVLALLCAGIAAIPHGQAAECELVLQWERARQGLAPSGARYEVSRLKSEEVLRSALEKAGAEGVSAQELASAISITPVAENDKALSMRYRVTCRGDFDGISAETLLELVMESYEENLRENELSAPDAPQPDWSGSDEMEYREVQILCENEAEKLLSFLAYARAEYPGFVSQTTGETFASIERQTENFLAVDLERYTAFVRQSGLARDSERAIYMLEHELLLRTLAGDDVESPAQNQELLARLKKGTAAEENAEKADALREMMQTKLLRLAESAAALAEEAAADSTYAPFLVVGPTTRRSTAVRLVAVAGVALCVAVAVCFAPKLLKKYPDKFRRIKLVHKKRACLFCAGAFALACFAGAAFWCAAEARQTCTARATVRCADGCEEDIFSEENVRAALQSTGISADVETICAGGSVTREEKEENVFAIKLTLDGSFCTEETRWLLDRILTCHAVRIGQEAAGLELPERAEAFFDSEYDCIEQAELLAALTNESLSWLESTAAPVALSYHFSALMREYQALRQTQLPELFAGILRGGLTKERDVLLKKYEERCERQALSPNESALNEGEDETEAPKAAALDVNHELLEIFRQSSESDAVAAAQAEAKTASIQAVLQALHPRLLRLNAQFCGALGAQAAAPLSSVTAQQDVNSLLYAALGAAGTLLLVFCAGSAVKIFAKTEKLDDSQRETAKSAALS